MRIWVVVRGCARARHVRECNMGSVLDIKTDVFNREVIIINNS